MKNFYLLIDDDLFGSYLLTHWQKRFTDCRAWKGVLLRGNYPSKQVVQARRTFHEKYEGCMRITPEIERELTAIYPNIDVVEKAMIRIYGIPRYASTHDTRSRFLGRNLNNVKVKQWLKMVCQDHTPWIFTYVTQILQSWWVELSHGRLVNSHSAVLPYARGVHSIENVAASQDIALFRKAAGITIHYIDEGIDTGAIIRTERIMEPFQFDSIWELKAYTYLMGDEVYTETAYDIVSHPERQPSGVIYDPKLEGPNFLSRDFTPERLKLAEEGYLHMKKFSFS